MTDEKQIKYINVALIGHVANGKTTLVKALTNVNTKRRSDEMKSGRTIKLGYANCLVWRCNNCGKVFTSGQMCKKQLCCNTIIDRPEYYVSFCDTPGHHSFVANMVKGVSIVDCAILVTDVRKTTLQMQTLEHLAIIEILGVKNIIVVQNKADLVNASQCYEHYKMLKTELQNTVAEHAPIIPVSAQSGLQLDKVQDYMYKMLQSVYIEPKPFNIFSVIRSFDINKPGTDVDALKGGVLGGTVLGNGFSVGDILEIRPGLIRSRDNFQPLQVQIRTIFSENKSLQCTVRGGLYGIGTGLDPTLTKNDGLAGSLMGRITDLPAVKTELKMKIVKVKLDDNGQSVKNNCGYKLIIGSNVVQAVCVSRNKPYGIMKLSRPICTIDTRCLIYSCENNKLIGFGVLDDDKVHSCTVSVGQSEEEYLQLLSKNEKEKVKVSIPVPVMMRENRNTIWSNMTVFCQMIHRQESQVVSYIQQELCVNVNVCSAGLRILKMRLKPTRLQKVLRGFVVANVMCEQCKGVNTMVRKNNRYTELVCGSCNSVRTMN